MIVYLCCLWKRQLNNGSYEMEFYGLWSIIYITNSFSLCVVKKILVDYSGIFFISFKMHQNHSRLEFSINIQEESAAVMEKS